MYQARTPEDQATINKINKWFPELIIQLDQQGKSYHWYLRCTSSEDIELPDGQEGFDNPVEALAHFAWREREECDELMGLLDEGEDDDDDELFEDEE